MSFSFGARPRLAVCGLLLASVVLARYGIEAGAGDASTSHRPDAAPTATAPRSPGDPGNAAPGASSPGSGVGPSSLGDLTTLAGGFLGDGGPATAAMFASAGDVAVAANGDVYVSDRYNHRIRKFTPGGVITTIAGNGTTSASGDGGPAVAAGLDNPTAIALDAAGNLFIADSGNHRIRKVTAGVISTVAGTGVAGSLGDGGPATAAQLNDPEGLALDAAGNVYVAEFSGNRVRKFAVGGAIQTIAGTGVASFSGDGGAGTAATLNRPVALVVNPAGDVFIADYNNHRVRKLGAGGTISTVAGNGTTTCTANAVATSASILAPLGLALDAAGELYVSSFCDVVLSVSPAGALTRIAGTGETGFNGDGYTADRLINSPAGIDVDATGGLTFADSGNNVVRRVALAAHTIATIAGRMDAIDGGTAPGGILGAPTDVAFGPSGALYVAEYDRGRVRRIAPNGTIDTVAGNGLFGNSGDGAWATDASIAQPYGIAVLPNEDVLIADRVYGVVRMVHNGLISTVAGGGTSTTDFVAPTSASLPGLTAIAAGSDGMVYVAVRNKVRRFMVGGTITTVAGVGAGSGTAGYNGDGIGATTAQLNGPAGLGIDAAGALYIADTNNHRVRKVSGGMISTVAGNGVFDSAGDGGAATSASIASPRDVAVDTDGRLYITEGGSSRIRAVSTAGTISTVAGTGVAGYNGDAGVGTAVQLAAPRGTAIRADGRLAIADRLNLRVRALQVAPAQVVLPTLTIADASTTEGNSGAKMLSLVVSLSKASADDVSFDLETDSGTASPGVDYMSMTTQRYSIPRGQLSVTFNVPIYGDTVAEDDESLVANLRAPTGATIARGQARARILNDDRPTLYVEDAQVVEGPAGGFRTVQVVVRLSSPCTFSTAALVQTGASPNATSGVDYVARSETMVVFDAGRTRQVFDVRIIGDDVAEATETLAVAARGLGDGAFNIGKAEGTLTILDDDGAAAIQARTAAARVNATTRLAPRLSGRSSSKVR